MNQNEKEYKLIHGYLLGVPVLYKVMTETGESAVLLSDGFARHLGFNNLEEMMSDNLVLDTFNAYKAKTGIFPVHRLKNDDNSGNRDD